MRNHMNAVFRIKRPRNEGVGNTEPITEHGIVVYAAIMLIYVVPLAWHGNNRVMTSRKEDLYEQGRTAL